RLRSRVGGGRRRLVGVEPGGRRADGRREEGRDGLHAGVEAVAENVLEEAARRPRDLRPAEQLLAEAHGVGLVRVELERAAELPQRLLGFAAAGELGRLDVELGGLTLAAPGEEALACGDHRVFRGLLALLAGVR